MCPIRRILCPTDFPPFRGRRPCRALFVLPAPPRGGVISCEGPNVLLCGVGLG